MFDTQACKDSGSLEKAALGPSWEIHWADNPNISKTLTTALARTLKLIL